MYVKKAQSCPENPEKSYAEKEAGHERSAWSMFKKCSFNEEENKPDSYREKGCTENLC